jgi:hypothetical protein
MRLITIPLAIIFPARLFFWPDPPAVVDQIARDHHEGRHQPLRRGNGELQIRSFVREIRIFV